MFPWPEANLETIALSAGGERKGKAPLFLVVPHCPSYHNHVFPITIN